MSALQLQTSSRIIEAMGSMINDKQKVNQVIGFIAYLGSMPEQTPLITQEELDRQCMPLNVAMDGLRSRTHDYFFATK